MEKIRNIILILILIILIIAISIFLLNLKQNNSENNTEILEGDAGETIEITNEVENVDNFATFKNVEQCIQQYYDIMNNESSIYYQKDENDNYIKISDERVNQVRLNLLSEEYKTKNNINLYNINKYINTKEEKSIVITLKMKELINTNVNKYLAKGIVIDFDNKFVEEFYIIVNIDSYNKTFSIEPILDEYENIDEIKIENNNESIEKNNNNGYYEKVYNYEDIAKSYFLTYKRLALAKPEILYNNYIDTEYKNQRFGNINNFQEYINKNREELSKITVKEYLINNYEDYIEYVVKDQYENMYIFKESADLKLNVMLDTYTITTDKFKETYAETEDIKKVQMNIDKFFQMINRHDYITSYNCISEGFKNNYFNTQEKFENFAKNQFFSYNKITFKSYEQKGSGLYIFNVELTDLTGESTEIRNVTIIIQLNDNLDFEMSFGIE